MRVRSLPFTSFRPWRWNHRAAFLTSGLASRRLPFGRGSDVPFPPPFLAGTAGWRHLLRPGGTALLCFSATRDPPGFRSLPKRLAVLPWPHCESFSAPPEKAELGLGSRHHLLIVPREKAGRKRTKKSMYQNRVSIIGFVGTTHNSGQARTAHLWRCSPSPPNHRGRTPRAAVTPGQSGIAAWPGGRSASSRPNSRKGLTYRKVMIMQRFLAQRAHRGDVALSRKCWSRPLS